MVSDSRESIVLGDTQLGVDMLIASKARPRVVKVHNNLAHAIALHGHFGDETIIILRLTGAEHIINRAKPPAPCAVEWCLAMEPAFKICPWAYFEVGPPLATADDWQRDFWLAAMNWMHARGYKGVVLTVGEGNPQLPSGGGDGWAPMWPVVQLAASYGFLLGPQAYWIDGRMDLDDDWHAFRIFRAFRDYPGKWPAGTRIVHTEFGIDLRGGDRGWQSSGCSAEAYREGLKAASDKFRTYPYPAGVEFVGFTIFALHDDKGDDTLWKDFNFWEIYPGILEDIVKEQTIEEAPPEPTPQPVPAGMVAITTTVSAGQYIRAHHSRAAQAVDDLDYNEVAYTSADEAALIGQAGAWIYARKADGTGGWMVAGLTKRVA